jgi:hypothetical protein
MRAVAVLAAVVLVASCSSPSTSPTPVPVPMSDPAKAPAAIVPTTVPSPSSSTGIVPMIDYPLGPPADADVAGHPGDAASHAPAGGSDGSTPAGGSPAPGASPGTATSPGPSAPASIAPSMAPGDIRLLLDHQVSSLPGGVTNLSSASNTQVLVYQYGVDTNSLSAAAPGCLRIGIKLNTSDRANFKGTDIAAATVSYTQLDNGVRSNWLGNYVPASANSQLTLDINAVNGVLTFQVKGMLLPNSGGSFGAGGASSSIFIDWTMKNLSTALPPAPSPNPSASPTAAPDDFFWTHM